MDDKYCVIEHCRIRYWEAGPSAEMPVLLLHGIGAALESWESLFNCLSAKFHVFAIDLPGFGRSDKNDRIYASRSVDFLEKFVVL